MQNDSIRKCIIFIWMLMGSFTVLQSEVKLSLYLTNSALRNEDVWRSGCIDPRFLDLDTSWRWVVQLHAPGTHSIGGWVSPRSGLDIVERWKFLTLQEFELRLLGRRARGLFLYLTKRKEKKNTNFSWL
jgi:hypothetical protein